MARTKTRSDDIRTQERRDLVLSLRKAGVIYKDIVQAVKNKFPESELPQNYDERQAYQDVRRELQKLMDSVQESASEIKTIETQRLEALFMAHFQKATKGDTKHADLCLKVHDRIMKLHGLDVTRVALTDKDGVDLAERLIRTQSLDGDAINSLLKGSEAKE